MSCTSYLEPRRGLTHDQKSPHRVDVQIRKRFYAVDNASRANPWVDLDHTRADAVNPAQFDMAEKIPKPQCCGCPNCMIAQLANFTSREAYGRSNQ